MTYLWKLIHHCTWANEVWIRFIRDNCPDDEYLLKRMSHVLLGEQAWFQRMSGEEPDRDIWRVMTIPEPWVVLDRHRSFYHDVLSGSVDRVIAFKRFTGEEYQSSVSDILLHLCLHGTHRRGQMATYVSSKGMKPIDADFVQFCIVNRL